MKVDQPLHFPDDTFDRVMAIGVLQTLTDPSVACREIWRVLKPGGLFVIVHVPKPAYYGGLETYSFPMGKVCLRLARTGSVGRCAARCKAYTLQMTADVGDHADAIVAPCTTSS